MSTKEVTIVYYDVDGNQCSKTIKNDLVPTAISGMKHCKEYDNVISKIKKGDNIVLMFEPFNEYDPNAIACYWKGIHIGYIPQKDVPVIMKQIAINKCSCEAIVEKKLGISVAIVVPYTNISQRQLIGAKKPKLKPMTEDERKEYEDFYDTTKDDESETLTRTLKIQIPYTKQSADAFERMISLKRLGNKCEYIGYIDSNKKALLYSEVIGVPVYVENEEIANHILNNKETYSFISNVITNKDEKIIELWFVITVILYDNKYITPKYIKNKNKKEEKTINEIVTYKNVTLPATYENLQFVEAVLNYKLKYLEDAVFLATKLENIAMLFNDELEILRPISDKDLKKRVLKGERLLVSMDVCDCEMSESIELKLTIICVDE